MLCIVGQVLVQVGKAVGILAQLVVHNPELVACRAHTKECKRVCMVHWRCRSATVLQMDRLTVNSCTGNSSVQLRSHFCCTYIPIEWLERNENSTRLRLKNKLARRRAFLKKVNIRDSARGRYPPAAICRKRFKSTRYSAEMWYGLPCMTQQSVQGMGFMRGVWEPNEIAALSCIVPTEP